MVEVTLVKNALQNGADLCVNHGDTLRERRASLSDEERKKEGENSIFSTAWFKTGRRRSFSKVFICILVENYT